MIDVRSSRIAVIRALRLDGEGVNSSIEHLIHSASNFARLKMMVRIYRSILTHGNPKQTPRIIADILDLHDRSHGFSEETFVDDINFASYASKTLFRWRMFEPIACLRTLMLRHGIDYHYLIAPPRAEMEKLKRLADQEIARAVSAEVMPLPKSSPTNQSNYPAVTSAQLSDEVFFVSALLPSDGGSARYWFEWEKDGKVSRSSNPDNSSEVTI